MEFEEYKKKFESLIQLKQELNEAIELKKEYHKMYWIAKQQEEKLRKQLMSKIPDKWN